MYVPTPLLCVNACQSDYPYRTPVCLQVCDTHNGGWLHFRKADMSEIRPATPPADSGCHQYRYLSGSNADLDACEGGGQAAQQCAACSAEAVDHLLTAFNGGSVQLTYVQKYQNCGEC